MYFPLGIENLVMARTCGGMPATVAYAMPWGMTVSPTVTPATRSLTTASPVYLGSQPSTGTLL